MAIGSGKRTRDKTASPSRSTAHDRKLIAAGLCVRCRQPRGDSPFAVYCCLHGIRERKRVRAFGFHKPRGPKDSGRRAFEC
jgi:hypothetical protein